MKAIYNAKIVMEEGILENATLIYNEKIKAIRTDLSVEGCEVLDAGGKYLFPGLIDIHIHGYYGREVLEGTQDAVRHMANNLVRDGVTGFLATLGTAPMKCVAESLDAVRNCISNNTEGAKLHGAYMEGVFISEEKKGAHDASFILPPDLTFVEKYQDVIRIMITPPEKYPDFINWCVEHGILCAMGHTNASYAEAMEGICYGAKQVTHLFNGMKGIHHRDSGIAGAALLADGVNVELIADTVHIAKELYKLVYRMKGADKIILITDSCMASGMGPGTYTCNNRLVHVDDFVGRLESGTISGSVVPLKHDVLNFHLYAGVPLHETVRMASLNPARILKLDHSLGSLQVGKCADMFLADGQMNVAYTFVDGSCVYRRH